MIRRFVSRFSNLLLVLGSVAVGVLVPQPSPYLDPLITPLVVFLVFTSLRGVRLAAIDYSSYAAVVALSLCLSYAVLPLAGIRLVEFAFAEADAAVLGFAIALSVPTTAGSAIIWTRLARGDVQLATITSIASLLLAPVATPLVLTRLVGSRIAVPTASILTDLAVIVGGGVLLTAAVPAGALSADAIERGSTLAILLLIYTAVAGAGVGGIDATALLAVIGVAVSLFGLGAALAVGCQRAFGIERGRAFSLLFTTNLKNLGIALLVSIPFADPLVTVSIIVYYVVQQTGGAVLADAT
ncbi:bile acid:Na+ symporter, BASS family [Halorubrum aquaticum]|uniref:Bile acid:Na+ symporter, BASS family n=1 Tax=Halorubrum aquaticum TaxID=387340 RepID=A0A1I2ZWA8_9EURY|nr:bile acid:sodium symporter [Halorubrum aquaticum]SFH42117.1 bile acid:Na+ symporter, BASS family [Halorubrum aquaticum]